MLEKRFRHFVALLTAIAFLTSPVYAEDAKPKPKPESQKEGDQTKERQSRRDLLRRVGRIGQPSVHERSHKKVKSAFLDVVKDVRLSTVRVFADDDQVALGAVVTSDGHVLTKSSQVKGNLYCRLANGQKLPAQVVGRDPETDLAMLKMNGEKFATVTWRVDAVPAVGSFVATTAIEESPAAFGIVSVSPREIRPPSGILGVLIDNDPRGARIDQVMPDSAAEKAGLRVNDVIALFNGTKVEGRDSLIAKVKALRPGTRVRLSVIRGDETLSLSATLGDRNKMDPNARRGNFQNSLGGELSERRAGFSSVLQHDTVLRPDQCGGPVVDLDGNVVGINIARAGRVESYALPVSVVQPLISEFLAGSFSPELANKNRIDELNQIIGKLEKSQEKLLAEITGREKALKEAEGAAAAAQKQVDQAIAALEKAQEQVAEAASSLEKAKSDQALAAAELKNVSAEKTTLEKELQD